jgi:peptidoglycan/xylan/chitin deacetylase (PgdA/CDA1 family)
MSTLGHIQKFIQDHKLFSTYTPILTYHHILKEPTSIPCAVCGMTLRQFTSQMQFLSEHGYVCLPLMDLLQPSMSNARRPEKAFVLTFDDGFEDFYSQAYPVLQKFGFTATIFLATDFVGKVSNWDDEKGSPMLTCEQIKTLSAQGFTFGSHTCSHVCLVDLPEDKVQHELHASKEFLEALLGDFVPILAFPFGDSNLSIRSLAQQARYQSSFGVMTGEPGPYNHWRMEVQSNDTLRRFTFKLTRWYSYYIKLRGWVRENTSLGRFFRKLKHQQHHSLPAGRA